MSLNRKDIKLLEKINNNIFPISSLAEKYNVKKISFPNYDSPACEPVKMYLAGKFGEDAMKVNPYPISMMYAIDRYASYKMDWEKFYKENEHTLS